MTDRDISMQPTTPSMPASPARPWRPRLRQPATAWLAVDLLAPTGVLYAMLWLGSGLYLALLVSAAWSAVTAIFAWWRGVGNQRLAPWMLAISLAAFAISLVTGSDRFLLAKESVLTAAAGLGFLASTRLERPLTYRLTRPLLEGRLSRVGPPWELLWAHEARFRRTWRVSSVLWAVVLLADAALRVVMAYTLPVEAVPALQTVLMVVTTLLMQVVTWVHYWRSGLWALVVRPYSPPRTEIRPT